MRVEPEQEQRPVLPRGIGGGPGGGPQRKGMVAAEDDREAALGQSVVDLVHQQPGPGDGFGQIVHDGIGAGDLGQVRERKVAPVLDPVAFGADFMGDPGNAVGGGAHQAARSLLARVDGRADQDGLGHGNLRL